MNNQTAQRIVKAIETYYLYEYCGEITEIEEPQVQTDFDWIDSRVRAIASPEKPHYTREALADFILYALGDENETSKS